MGTLNTAVIGVGSMGYNHARVYSELDSVKLLGVADPDKARFKRVSGDFSCNGYGDYRELLKSEEVDAVSICVPTQYHKEVAIDCLDAGVNVLVEKPISDSVSAGKEIIEKAGKQDLKLMVGHIERFNPAVIKLKQEITAGRLGKAFKLHSRREGPFPNRIRDVGVVIDLAVHDIDLMRYFTESEVKRVYAEAERRIHTSHEDLLSGLLKFRNDSIGVLSVNWLTPEKIREMSVVGEKGMLVVKYLTQELWYFENGDLNGRDYTYSDILMGVSEGDITGIRVKKQEPLKNELSYFIESVENGEDPLPGGLDGLKAVEIAEAVIDSCTKNKVVSF